MSKKGKSERDGKPGRKMEFPENLQVPLAAGTIDRLDAVRADGEPRLDVIRAGINGELKRREKRAKKAEPGKP